MGRPDACGFVFSPSITAAAFAFEAPVDVRLQPDTVRKIPTPMKIAFTQKEYARLLEMSYIAMWVAGSHDENSPAARRYAELEQKLLAAAAPMGCADYVDGDPALGEPLSPSQKFDDEDSAPAKAIDAFEDASFWDGLASRLAERDYAREVLKTPLPAGISDGERDEHLMKRVGQLEEKYWAEFEKSGLDNLLVLFGTDRLS